MADASAREAIFNCSVCDTPKKFQHPSWKTRKGADTFCNVCRKVTYHKNNNIAPAPAPAPTPAPTSVPVPAPANAGETTLSNPIMPPADTTGIPVADDKPTAGAPVPPVPAPVAQPAAAVQPTVPGPGKVATIPIDELWKDFVLRITAKGSKPEDLAGATTSTIHDVLRDLGYDALNSARLQTELHYRIPRQPAPQPQPQPTPQPQPSLVPSVGPQNPPSQTLPQPQPGTQPAELAAGAQGVPAPAPGAPASASAPTPTPAPAPVPDAPGAQANPNSTAAIEPPYVPPELVHAETSVSGLDEDSLLRQTQKTMEEELKRMDEELEKLRKEASRQAANQKEAKGDKEAKDAKGDKEEKAKVAADQVPADTPIPYPELNGKISEDLWPVLVERLAACGLSEADVAACTPLTFEKVLLYLAFSPLERARLIQEFTVKYGANLKNTGPSPPEAEKPPEKPAVAFDLPDEVDHEPTPLDITGPPTGATLPYVGGVAYETGTNLKHEPALIDPSSLHRYPNWKGPGWASHASAQPPSESDGFQEEGFEPVIRCPAHSERDIEFWCVACEALVCSLCHISGHHKDHPFVPMSEAARKECPGLGDWQMRAATVRAKLQDNQASLLEVHQNIDDYHQQQIDAVVDSIENIKSQLETHKDSLIRRIQGHAAAQHQLYSGSNERMRDLTHSIQQAVNKMDILLCAKPDSMTPEDARRWAYGIMKMRSTVGTTFAEAARHPIVVPNYTNLKYNNEVVPDDLFGKAYLSRVPTPVGMPSYLDMRELSHPLFSSRDRLNFTWATPDPSIDYDGNGGKNPLVLNNNLLTCTYAGTGSGHVLVKGTATFEAGKHYWEVRIDAMHNDNRLGTHVIMGLVAEGTTSMGSTTGLAWCVDKLSGMVPMSLDCPPWIPGSLLGIFLDLDLDRVGLYFNKQCVAHVAIPHGRYTPAASIHCFHDQITLIPLAEIPTGVSLTSGLITQNSAYRLPGPSALVAKNVPSANVSTLDPEGSLEISYLQEECLKLRQSVSEAKRDIVEQQRVQAQQNFQEQQIKDLKARIDETAQLMAKQAMEFEQQAADDLRKLQEYQKNQIEDETKRAWQMQLETAQRARDVAAAHERQQNQANKLERFLREQQVQITQQMLDRQRLEEEDLNKQRQQDISRHALQQQLLKQQLMQPPRGPSIRASPRRDTSPMRSAPSPVPVMPTYQAPPPMNPTTLSLPPQRQASASRPISPPRARGPAVNGDSAAALREFIEMAGRLT
eukprot:TRINITY_DN2944_c1_g2_i2.p1 TRINITY_DN2944_c1_g2~~TRINITY_DN2944_c1_g2_i2.p1  ORF type:complete len:1254 (+),score=249.62 TRINITY_DN2944_c1_g2_i2:27-3764(+)